MSAGTPHDRISSRASGNTLHSLDPLSEPDESRLAHLLVDRSDEFILWVDVDARLLYGNPAICRALGYSQAEFSSLHLSDISPRTPEIWRGLWEELKQLLSQNFEAELRTRSGGIIPVHFNANYIGGKEFVLCCGRDLRQQIIDESQSFVRGPEGSRRQSEQMLAQLSGRLLEMQDEERRRVARQLHDTIGQNLSALSIGLSTILSNHRIDPHTRQALNESLALADGCIREIRTVSYLLHPPLLDELGLTPALRVFSEGYSERTGIQLELDLPAHMPRMPQVIETTLFRIAEEGLADIHLHSGSRRAGLRLKDETGQVRLELTDFGRGQPPGILESTGVGILSMRERARRLGGRLNIASEDTGATLIVVLPTGATA